VQAGVDDLHPRIPESRGDDLGAPVMSIEAGFGNEYSNWSHRVIKVSRCDARAANPGGGRFVWKVKEGQHRTTQMREDRSIDSRDEGDGSL
jgi:hypothetical protein